MIGNGVSKENTAIPVIEADSVSKFYRSGEVDVHALESVSLRVHRGEFTAIAGPSGLMTGCYWPIAACQIADIDDF